MTAMEARTGRFREFPGASPWVDAVWVHEAGERLNAMIPADGCVDLIARIGVRGAIQGLVHSPSATAHRVIIAEGQRVIGVRVRAGYGMPALARRTELVQNAVARLRSGAELSELEALVAETIDAAGPPPALIREFMEFSAETRGAVRLAERGFLPSAERGLQRVARKWLGLTPKAFLRIERTRAAQQGVCRGQPLADVAVEYGYSDQAHLSREFRSLLGVTPTQVRFVGILQDRAEGGE